MMTTGGSASGSYGTGAILVSTGDSTGNTNTGALMLSTGNTTGGDIGSVFLRTGIATDPAGVNDIAFSRLQVQPKETRFSTGNMSGAGTVGGTDLFLEGGDAKLEAGSTPTDNTISGGNVVIKTGQVRIAGSGTFGSEDAGNILSNEGDPLGYGMVQDRGEIVIASKSAPSLSSETYNRFLGVNHDGVLSSLNIQTLGYGTVVLNTPEDNTQISWLPLFFTNRNTNSSGTDLDLEIGAGVNDQSISEFYSGVDVWNGQVLYGWITDTNLSVSIDGMTVNDSSAPFTEYDYMKYPILNVDIATLGGTPYLRLVFSDTSTDGINAKGTNPPGSVSSLYIHYTLKHRSYS
jgi:hypothetical protein